MGITPKNKNSGITGEIAEYAACIEELIASVEEATEGLSRENPGKRVALDTTDPLLIRLADAFNHVLEHVEATVNRQAMFISDASHEMRTPISVIKGYADLIDRWGKRDPEILQESIDAIKMETEHMNALINSLLVLAKGDDESLLQERRLVSLNRLASDVVKEVVMLHSIDTLELVELSQESIYADMEMILRLIWILVENALKYGNGHTEPIKVTVSGDTATSYLMVEDHGQGISAEDIPHIFERFYRADKSRSNTVPGFGLGLAVADMIVKTYNARITVDSQLGAGTTFTVAFPK